MNIIEFNAKNLFVIVAFIALTAGISFAQVKGDPNAAEIDKLFSKYNMESPGVAIAVVKDGKLVFAKGYGSANLEFGQPITSTTVFQIASVSKQFTAFAVYLLEKQGKISLEDDVRKYVPELPDYGRTVRIRHLLAHTGGVKDQAAVLALAGWRPGDVTTTADVMTFVGRQKELNFEPGSRFLYSNSGYTLLAEIVGRVTGESFAEFARKNIFAPLGMTNTQVCDDKDRIISNRADSYELENSVYKKRIVNDSTEGSSNIYTTVEDMAKWSMNFETGVVGGRELIDKFNAPSLLDNGERVVWGISDGEPGFHAKGQIHWNYRGLHLMSHGGHSAAYRSFHGRFPEQRLAVIALSNDEHYANFDDSIKVAEIYLKDKLSPLKSTSNQSLPAVRKDSSEPDVKTFEGRFYNAELDTAYDASLVNGKIQLNHNRHGRIELSETAKDKFRGTIVFAAEFELIRDSSGAITAFRVSNFGAKNIVFTKVK